MSGEGERGAWLTAGEVAARMRVSKRLVWGMAAKGQLTSYRLSQRATRFATSDIDEYIASARRGGAS